MNYIIIFLLFLSIQPLYTMQFTLVNNTYKAIDFALYPYGIQQKSFYDVRLASKGRVTIDLKKIPEKIKFLKDSGKYIYQIYPKTCNYVSIDITDQRNLMVNIGLTEDRITLKSQTTEIVADFR